MSSLKVIQDSKNPTQIRSILAVAAGKGGVGKSTVAVNLALALKLQGFKVGLLDADIYGPSLEQMLPKGMEPVDDLENPEKLLPALTFGMPFISVAHFKKKASIVRAPIANQIIEQFLTIVQWGELDYLIIDFPPGTGDIQLTLMQKAKIAAAIMVTTPQVVATLDVSKAIQLFQKMEIPILGVVENMSYFLDPETQKKFFPFSSGGGQSLAKDFEIPFLGEIPIDSKISIAGDRGDSSAVGVFKHLCERVLQEVSHLSKEDFQVREKGPHHLEIFIEDSWHTLSLHDIQKQCPCARCQSEKKCDPGVSLLEFSPVGRYAIRLIFSSGCSQGIYPYSQLKLLV
ncbi:MAG: Iron-sulfur cluster carrier protein [Chlamydiae bacterium]|nr:Iron-sulfur cluster carrier protein [Chlamydiota bacterium]